MISPGWVGRYSLWPAGGRGRRSAAVRAALMVLALGERSGEEASMWGEVTGLAGGFQLVA